MDIRNILNELLITSTKQVEEDFTEFEKQVNLIVNNSSTIEEVKADKSIFEMVYTLLSSRKITDNQKQRLIVLKDKIDKM